MANMMNDEAIGREWRRTNREVADAANLRVIPTIPRNGKRNCLKKLTNWNMKRCFATRPSNLRAT